MCPSKPSSHINIDHRVVVCRLVFTKMESHQIHVRSENFKNYQYIIKWLPIYLSLQVRYSIFSISAKYPLHNMCHNLSNNSPIDILLPSISRVFFFCHYTLFYNKQTHIYIYLLGVSFNGIDSPKWEYRTKGLVHF